MRIFRIYWPATFLPVSFSETMIMPTTDLWAATLSMLLIHEETGCRQSALHAARMLDRISDMDIDDETR